VSGHEPIGAKMGYCQRYAFSKPLQATQDSACAVRQHGQNAAMKGSERRSLAPQTRSPLHRMYNMLTHPCALSLSFPTVGRRHRQGKFDVPLRKHAEWRVTLP